jgi:hypothetical protein
VISRAPAKEKGGVCLLLALTRPFLDGTPRPLADISRFLHSGARPVRYGTVRCKWKVGQAVRY